MSVTSRAYVHTDLAAVRSAVAGWRRAAGWCGYPHPGDIDHRIYETLRGCRPVGELVHLWEDASGIAGVAICGKFGTSFDVVVRPSIRGSATEVDMLASAAEITERYLASDDAAEAAVISDVFGCDTTRAAALSNLGFERYRRWDHLSERLLTEPIPAEAVPRGYTVRVATAADAAPLADVRNHTFGGAWSAAAYRREVMSAPGYDPAREVVVEAPDGRFAAFADIWFDDVNRVGMFEPVGTHDAFRRRGLGRAVLIEGLRRMRAAGMATATIEFDATNAAAARLYAGMGFEKRHETFGYRRRVGGKSP